MKKSERTQRIRRGALATHGRTCIGFPRKLWESYAAMPSGDTLLHFSVTVSVFMNGLCRRFGIEVTMMHTVLWVDGSWDVLRPPHAAWHKKCALRTLSCDILLEAHDTWAAVRFPTRTQHWDAANIRAR